MQTVAIHSSWPSIGYAYLHGQTHSHWEDILMVPDIHNQAYCRHQVYTSFHVCSGNCHMDLKEKTNIEIAFVINTLKDFLIEL